MTFNIKFKNKARELTIQYVASYHMNGDNLKLWTRPESDRLLDRNFFISEIKEVVITFD